MKREGELRKAQAALARARERHEREQTKDSAWALRRAEQREGTIRAYVRIEDALSRGKCSAMD